MMTPFAAESYLSALDVESSYAGSSRRLFGVHRDAASALARQSLA